MLMKRGIASVSWGSRHAEMGTKVKQSLLEAESSPRQYSGDD